MHFSHYCSAPKGHCPTPSREKKHVAHQKQNMQYWVNIILITLLLRWGMWWIVFYFSHFSNLTRD